MERKEYKKSVLEYKDVQGAIICAREDGVEEGFEKGTRQLVQNMLAEGIALDIIARVSGLSNEEISKMKQQ